MAEIDAGTQDVLARLSSATREALLLLDTRGHARFASDACRELLAASPQASDRSALLAEVHPDDRPAVESLLASSQRGEDRLRMRVRSPADREFGPWRSLEMRVERDASGVTARFLDVVQGVPAPGDARTPLELIASHLEDVLWLVDHDQQTLLYVSEGFEAMFGRSRETLQAGPWAFYDAIHPDDREGLRKAALEGLESGWAHEFRVVLPDESTRWVRQRSVPVRIHGTPQPLGVGITQDIDKRKRAEEARRESERRFEVLTGSAFDVLSEVDARGITLWSSTRDDNATFPGPSHYTGQPRLDLIHEDDRDLVIRAFAAAFKNGEQTTLEYRAMGPEGRRHWIETSVNPFVTESGECRALFVTRDVSKRRELIQALADSEERFRLLAENSHEFIAEYDQNARLLYANERVLNAAGKTLEECAAQSPFEDIHPDDLPAVEERLSNLSGESGTVQITFRRLHRDGGWRWMDSHMHMHLTASGEPRAVCISRDVTERVQAENRLRASEARYRLLVERSPEAIVVHADGRVLYANPAALRLVGANSADAVLGQPVANWITPSSASAALIPGAGLDRSQYRVRRLDGVARDVLGSDSRISYAGRPAVQTVFRDITQWKRAERQRQQLQVQLQESRKLESLGVLAGGVAHDFNNLLAVILGNTRFALRHTEEPDESGDVREALDDAIEAAESAARLTRQLLAYAGRRAPEVRPVDLTEHVRSLAGLLEAAVPKRVELHLDLAHALPSVRADVVQLEQVTMNLVRNAADSIGDEDGSVAVATRSIHASAQELRAWTGSGDLAPGHYAMLEVRDTGCGMTPETRQRIFDPFYTTKTNGHGLGLSAVLGLVRGHDGGIAIDSEPGRGTSIRVLLPAAEDSAGDHETPAAGTTTLEATVLVVDDEAGVRRMVRRTLEACGCTVVEAEDGLEAQARLRERAGDIDVVLLDINMPRAGGEETLALLRAIAPDLPVLLSSGDDENGISGRLGDDPRSAFLAKPYRDDQLLGRLEDLLQPTRGE